MLGSAVRKGRTVQDGTFEGLGAPARKERTFGDKPFEGLGAPIFRDETFESLGRVGVNNVEFVRSDSSACFVNNPTGRRRGGVGIQTCYVGPTPRTPVLGGGSLGPMWGPLPQHVPEGWIGDIGPMLGGANTETKRGMKCTLWLKCYCCSTCS